MIKCIVPSKSNRCVNGNAPFLVTARLYSAPSLPSAQTFVESARDVAAHLLGKCAEKKSTEA